MPLTSAEQKFIQRRYQKALERNTYISNKLGSIDIQLAALEGNTDAIKQELEAKRTKNTKEKEELEKQRKEIIDTGQKMSDSLRESYIETLGNIASDAEFLTWAEEKIASIEKMTPEEKREEINKQEKELERYNTMHDQNFFTVVLLDLCKRKNYTIDEVIENIADIINAEKQEDQLNEDQRFFFYRLISVFREYNEEYSPDYPDERLDIKDYYQDLREMMEKDLLEGVISFMDVREQYHGLTFSSEAEEINLEIQERQSYKTLQAQLITNLALYKERKKSLELKLKEIKAFTLDTTQTDLIRFQLDDFNQLTREYNLESSNQEILAEKLTQIEEDLKLHKEEFYQDDNRDLRYLQNKQFILQEHYSRQQETDRQEEYNFNFQEEPTLTLQERVEEFSKRIETLNLENPEEFVSRLKSILKFLEEARDKFMEGNKIFNADDFVQFLDSGEYFILDEESERIISQYFSNEPNPDLPDVIITAFNAIDNPAIFLLDTIEAYQVDRLIDLELELGEVEEHIEFNRENRLEQGGQSTRDTLEDLQSQEQKLRTRVDSINISDTEEDAYKDSLDVLVEDIVALAIPEIQKGFIGNEDHHHLDEYEIAPNLLAGLQKISDASKAEGEIKELLTIGDYSLYEEERLAVELFVRYREGYYGIEVTFDEILDAALGYIRNEYVLLDCKIFVDELKKDLENLETTESNEIFPDQDRQSEAYLESDYETDNSAYESDYKSDDENDTKPPTYQEAVESNHQTKNIFKQKDLSKEIELFLTQPENDDISLLEFEIAINILYIVLENINLESQDIVLQFFDELHKINPKNDYRHPHIISTFINFVTGTEIESDFLDIEESSIVKLLQNISQLKTAGILDAVEKLQTQRENNIKFKPEESETQSEENNSNRKNRYSNVSLTDSDSGISTEGENETPPSPETKRKETFHLQTGHKVAGIGGINHSNQPTTPTISAR